MTVYRHFTAPKKLPMTFLCLSSGVFIYVSFPAGTIAYVSGSAHGSPGRFDEAVQLRRKLSAGDGISGSQAAVSVAAENVGSARPAERGDRVLRSRVNVVKAEDVRVLADRDVHLLVLRVAIEERGGLLSGDNVVDAEASVVITVRDAGLLCPRDCPRERVVLSDVGEEPGALSFGSALGAPERLDKNGAGHVCLGFERVLGHTVDETVVPDIADVIEEPLVGGHIGVRELGDFLPAGVNGDVSVHRDLVTGLRALGVEIPAGEDIAFPFARVRRKVNRAPLHRPYGGDCGAAVRVKGQGIEHDDRQRIRLLRLGLRFGLGLGFLFSEDAFDGYGDGAECLAVAKRSGVKQVAVIIVNEVFCVENPEFKRNVFVVIRTGDSAVIRYNRCIRRFPRAVDEILPVIIVFEKARKYKIISNSVL